MSRQFKKISNGLYNGLTEEQEQERWLYRRYTRKVLYSPKERFHLSIPHAISEVVNQAQSVIYSSPRGSFILCRAVLEEICDEFKIPRESLNKKGKKKFDILFEEFQKAEENIFESCRNGDFSLIRKVCY